jgi:SHS2 domain-containing protein
MPLKYRLIDHTADFGIHVFGADAGELFKNAGTALFDVLTDLDPVEESHSRLITCHGQDWPDLMVNWLRELLYLWNGKQQLLKRAAIEYISEYRLRATLFYDPYDPDRHAIREEIKAVTYHQIDVKKRSTGWESKIIFDV